MHPEVLIDYWTQILMDSTANIGKNTKLSTENINELHL
jgi:hypothetical protein